MTERRSSDADTGDVGGGRGPSTPADVDHPVLRELAIAAAWVAKLEEALEMIEDLAVDVIGNDEQVDGTTDRAVWDEEPLDVAASVIESAYEEADRDLEDSVLAWLGEDPEHWPIFRLVLLDGWQAAPGRWREGTPRWVRSIATNTIIAHYQNDPFGRRQMLDLSGV